MSIDAIVELILTWQTRSGAQRSRDTDTLFTTLATATEPHIACEIEDQIWEMWTSHEDPTVNASMDEAIAAIARKDYRLAEGVLDRLVDEHAHWAEAWNKRATLFFLQGRRTESLRDISRTLELEPRHFGAMAGFAQICLRTRRLDAARIALETVLLLHPQSETTRAILQSLPREQRPTLH